MYCLALQCLHATAAKPCLPVFTTSCLQTLRLDCQDHDKLIPCIFQAKNPAKALKLPDMHNIYQSSLHSAVLIGRMTIPQAGWKTPRCSNGMTHGFATSSSSTEHECMPTLQKDTQQLDYKVSWRTTITFDIKNRKTLPAAGTSICKCTQ